jgi:hypothetical protein
MELSSERIDPLAAQLSLTIGPCQDRLATANYRAMSYFQEDRLSIIYREASFGPNWQSSHYHNPARWSGR